MSKLRLGPLPKTDTVRLTIMLPAKVRADLDRYAEVYRAEYGEAVDAAALVPHILAAFMARDRGFQRASHSAPAEPKKPAPAPASISSAASSTRDTADDV
ncbi:MAG: DUF2274 domain-containing protein [Pseudomonadota bacterium]|nr:DUF2274 domain-containing protein [Pseudomonadota bacterium]